MYKRQVHVQATVTLQEEKFLIDADSVKVSSKGLILTCEPHVDGCKTPYATYVWYGRDPLSCKTALTKTTSGVVTYTDDDKEVFMSTDGELIRLILGSSITTCQTIVRETNYDLLLVYEGESKVFLDRTLPAREVDLTLYINNRDDFLYNHILNRVEEEMNQVLNSACRARTQANHCLLYTSDAADE